VATSTALRPVGPFGDPTLGPLGRLALWIRAAGGVAAILAGTLVFGAVGSVFTTSAFVVTVDVEAAAPALALDSFKQALQADWPGIVFEGAADRRHGPGHASPACPRPATPVVFLARATRPQFSSQFGTLPALASESGLHLCTYSYQSHEMGGLGVPAQPVRAGAPYLALVLAGMLLWWRAGYGRAPFPASRQGSGRALMFGAMTGIAVAAAMIALALVAVALEFRLPTRPETISGELGPWLWLAVLTTVVIPFVEEFAFRAWFLPQATPAVGAAVATVASGVLFSAIHFPAVPVQAVGLFLISVALSILWYRTGSLLACVTAHGVYNAIVLAGLELA
jgi:membrane protease YdiL (CAAX protease family)